MIIKCDNCNRSFRPATAPDGTPAGMGFKLQNGKLINICRSCMISIAMMDDKQRNKIFKKLGVNIDGK